MSLDQTLFKYRGYAPVPFLILMIVFADPTPLSMGVGFALALGGELLRAWGVFLVGSETRVTGSVGASRLVTSGPFSYVRNPLYVGNMTMYIGIGIMSMALFPWLQIAALAWFVFQYTLIVKGEEKYLREKFGDEYAAYCKAVPRFFTRLTPYSSPTAVKIDWKAGWHSEARTLQAFVLVTAIILVIWIVR